MKRAKEYGITLIALVITIIILLILAGVTIGIATSGTGLFDKAKYAVEKYNNSQIEEENEVAKLLNMIDGNVDSSRGITPEGTIEITENGNYDVTKYASAQVMVNDPAAYENKTYTQEGLSIRENRATITNGGYYVDESGTTWVNITFKAEKNMSDSNGGACLIIYGLPNVNDSFVILDKDNNYAFRIGNFGGFNGRIDLIFFANEGIDTNTICTLQFKY